MTKHFQRIVLAQILRLKSWVNLWQTRTMSISWSQSLPTFQSWLANIAETLVQAKSGSVIDSAQTSDESLDSLVICHLFFTLFEIWSQEIEKAVQEKLRNIYTIFRKILRVGRRMFLWAHGEGMRKFHRRKEIKRAFSVLFQHNSRFRHIIHLYVLWLYTHIYQSIYLLVDYWFLSRFHLKLE